LSALCRFQAEIPLILIVQFSRATSKKYSAIAFIFSILGIIMQIAFIFSLLGTIMQVAFISFLNYRKIIGGIERGPNKFRVIYLSKQKKWTKL